MSRWRGNLRLPWEHRCAAPSNGLSAPQKHFPGRPPSRGNSTSQHPRNGGAGPLSLSSPKAQAPAPATPKLQRNFTSVLEAIQTKSRAGVTLGKRNWTGPARSELWGLALGSFLGAGSHTGLSPHGPLASRWHPQKARDQQKPRAQGLLKAPGVGAPVWALGVASSGQSGQETRAGTPGREACQTPAPNGLSRPCPALCDCQTKAGAHKTSRGWSGRAAPTPRNRLYHTQSGGSGVPTTHMAKRGRELPKHTPQDPTAKSRQPQCLLPPRAEGPLWGPRVPAESQSKTPVGLRVIGKNQN